MMHAGYSETNKENENTRQKSHKFAVPSRSTMKECWDVIMRKVVPTHSQMYRLKCQTGQERKAKGGYRPRSAILTRRGGTKPLNARQEKSKRGERNKKKKKNPRRLPGPFVTNKKKSKSVASLDVPSLHLTGIQPGC
jgi:hypothetical protein